MIAGRQLSSELMEKYKEHNDLASSFKNEDGSLNVDNVTETLFMFPKALMHMLDLIGTQKQTYDASISKVQD